MSNLVYAGAGHVFPEVVRRLNMLWPSRWSYTTEGVQAVVEDWTVAHYFSSWLPYNLQLNVGADVESAAFGGTVTAPDGTDTAILMKDTTSYSEHSFIAGTQGTGAAFYGKVRLDGVFKYAGRRIVLSLMNGKTSTGGVRFGCKAVFDLFNGAIAIDNTEFGTSILPWVVYPAQMRAIGNGWYHCSVEAKATGGTIGSLWGKVSLDNGFGSVAESSTYTGNGTSGVYGWRSSMLPSRAWDLSEEVFFDDFDDASTIDYNNTKAPGFNWYVSSPWPQYDAGFVRHGVPPPDPEWIIVQDSYVRTMHSVRAIGTAASTWVRTPTAGYPPTLADPPRNYTDGWVGQTFTRPALFESRARWTAGSQGLSIWTSSLEALLEGYLAPKTADYVEIDFIEVISGGGKPYLHSHYAQADGSATRVSYGEIALGQASYTDIDVWRTALSYGGGRHVEHLGVLYTALRTTNSDPPDSSPLDWGPYNPTNDYEAVPPVGDYSDWHEYSCMCFPWTEDELGQQYVFWDGGFCGAPLIYGPEFAALLSPPVTGVPPDGTHHLNHLADWQSLPVFVGSSSGTPETGNPDPAITMDTDWVRVITTGGGVVTSDGSS